MPGLQTAIVPADAVECRSLSIGARYIYPFLTLYAVDRVQYWEMDFEKVWSVLGISAEYFWVHMKDLEEHGFIRMITTKEELREGMQSGKFKFLLTGEIDYELRRRKKRGNLNER